MILFSEDIWKSYKRLFEIRSNLFEILTKLNRDSSIRKIWKDLLKTSTSKTLKKLLTVTVNLNWMTKRLRFYYKTGKDC